MPHIRTRITLRASPVSTVAGGVHAFVRCGLACFNTTAQRFDIATTRRQFDGISEQN